jgi:hypothetical protein
MGDLKYPCRNKEEGCPEMLSLAMVKEHDALCVLGIHECAVNKIYRGSCNWKGYWDDFEIHVREVHEKAVNKSTFESTSTFDSWDFISKQGKYFLFDKRKSEQRREWLCTVILIGTRAEAAHYKTVFTLSAKNGVDSNVDTRRVWSFTEQLDHIHSSPKRFSLSTSVMGNFITGDRMNLKVKVQKLLIPRSFE